MPGFSFARFVARMERSAIRGLLGTLSKVGYIRRGASSTPIARQYAGANVSVQGRKRPFHRRRHQSMLDRVEMNIVRAALKVVVVADRVFPKASLPKRILAAVIAANICASCDDAAGEPGLDGFPAARKIRIAGRAKSEWHANDPARSRLHPPQRACFPERCEKRRATIRHGRQASMTAGRRASP
jgi:hypothetical protein